MAPNTVDFASVKETGNSLFKEGKIMAALELYSQALLLATGDLEKEKVAVLKNQAACYLKLDDYEKCCTVSSQGRVNETRLIARLRSEKWKFFDIPQNSSAEFLKYNYWDSDG